MDTNNNEIIERQHQREAIDKKGWTTGTHITRRERETDAEKGIVHLYNGRINGDPDKDT